MKTTSYTVIASLLAPLLAAQAPTTSGASKPSTPKVAEHAALARFVGNWRCEAKASAVPGVPGMEEEKTWTGHERASLACDGLFLKVDGTSTCGDERMQGIWIAGYDPTEKQYTMLCASSMDEPSMLARGEHDAATGTWTFRGETPHGAFRSVLVFENGDRCVETCWFTPKGGEEAECMRVTRTRAAADYKGAAADAAALRDAAPSAEYEPLYARLGTWRCEIATDSPDAPAERGEERVTACCGGRWLWSDFDGSIDGRTVEGHGLIGYDANSKRYVCHRIDSTCPTITTSTGQYDAAAKKFEFSGTCVGPDGKVVQVQETCTHPADDRRIRETTLVGPSGKQKVEIVYTRKDS